MSEKVQILHRRYATPERSSGRAPHESCMVYSRAAKRSLRSRVCCVAKGYELARDCIRENI